MDDSTHKLIPSNLCILKCLDARVSGLAWEGLACVGPNPGETTMVCRRDAVTLCTAAAVHGLLCIWVRRLHKRGR
jgi:hypothetical protein